MSLNLKRGAGVAAGFVGAIAGLVTLLEWVGVEFADLRAAITDSPWLLIAIVLLAGAILGAVAFTVMRSSRSNPGPSSALASPQLPATAEPPPSAPRTRQGCVSIQVTVTLGLVLLAGAALWRSAGVSNQVSAPPMTGGDAGPPTVVVAMTPAPPGQPATPWGRSVDADGTPGPATEPPIMVDPSCAGAGANDPVGANPTCEAAPPT